jgi:hypothetical protein
VPSPDVSLFSAHGQKLRRMPVVFHPKMMLAKAWHRQRQLHIVITAFVPICEILQVKRDVSRLKVAAAAQFAGDILGNIFRPALGGIEGDDADRVTILAGQQVLNYRFRGRWFRNWLRARRGLIDRNHPPLSRPSHRCRSGLSTAPN